MALQDLDRIRSRLGRLNEGCTVLKSSGQSLIDALIVARYCEFNPLNPRVHNFSAEWAVLVRAYGGSNKQKVMEIMTWQQTLDLIDDFINLGVFIIRWGLSRTEAEGLRDTLEADGAKVELLAHYWQRKSAE